MRMELLSPAGNEDALIAAVQNGADAVYLGGKAFGARAAAANFDGPALEKAVAYCHLRGVRVYMTVNTLVKEAELEEGLSLVEQAVQAGVDAFLVQDLGLSRLLLRAFPGICLHASTQMSLNNADGAAMAARLGLRRVVAARECSLEEIAAMAGTGLEVEVFAHGALCMGFSGQCLFSSAIGGRSGNRGRCAQPCRLPYWLGDSLCYALSTKDLCCLYDLPALMRAGACSIKLEGRLKRPEYVAVVTRAYRQALDLALEGKKPGPEALEALLSVFNRGGFTRGYAFSQRDGEALFQQRPNHQGVHVGSLVAGPGGRTVAKLLRPLQEGDGLEARAEGAAGVGVQVSGLKPLSGGLTQLRLPPQARPGMELYRTTDALQMERARQSYDRDVRKRPVRLRARLRVGESARLWLDGVEAEGETVQAARGKPLTEEQALKQLCRLGDTPFSCEEAQVDMEEGAFLPVSALNALRREAVAALEREILERSKPKLGRGEAADAPPAFSPRNPTLLVHQSASLEELLSSPADELYWQPLELGENALQAGLPHLPKNKAFLSLPPYLTQGELDEVWRALQPYPELGVVANNLSQLRRFAGRPLRAGEGLNVFNSQTAAQLRELGVERVCASPELSLAEAKKLAARTPTELFACGTRTLMCMRSCPIRAQHGLGAKGRESCSLCHGHGATLTDRKGEKLRLQPYRTAGGCTLLLQAARPFNAMPRLRPEDLSPFVAVKVIGGAQEARYVKAVLLGRAVAPPFQGEGAGQALKGVE